ncbi:isochorismatase domain protein [Streptococcus pyogenes GA40634]|nr:isochorismatase domain protein [Streptococcus pyogenes GA40634]
MKQHPRVFWIDKRYYSALSGTDLDIRLRERGITQLVLTGVLSDICVLHTAIDAYHLGYQLEIVKSAVASLTKESYEWSLAHFEQVLGAKLINDY